MNETKQKSVKSMRLVDLPAQMVLIYGLTPFIRGAVVPMIRDVLGIVGVLAIAIVRAQRLALVHCGVFFARDFPI